MARSKQARTLDDYMTERVRQLGMSWAELEARAGVTKKTMLHIRAGGNSYPKTIRNVEAALGWALGSIEAVKAGGEPTVVDVDAVLRAPSVGLYHPAPAADDPAVQLRQLRARMGATAFWREINMIRDEEEATLGNQPTAP